MILEMQHIYKTYRQTDMDVEVLKDIDFSVEEGEYIAITGPSGSGKTTLMNLIGALDSEFEGTMLLDGENVGEYSDNELSDLRLKKIGFVFQNFELLPQASAIKNVCIPLMYAQVDRKERNERARAALERVGLSDRMDFLPSQLSGGQKQRVAIARAIINRPRILLADEPTGALDSASGESVMKLFDELNAEGITIIMITHDAKIAARARRQIALRDGELV